MVLASRSMSALLKQANGNAHGLENQHQHDGVDIPLPEQTRGARFQMSLWGHYVTMSRGDLNSACEQIYRCLTNAGQKNCLRSVDLTPTRWFRYPSRRQTSIARFKMSLWGHYVTMSRDECNSASKLIRACRT
jgi:hypothetical protein